MSELKTMKSDFLVSIWSPKQVKYVNKDGNEEKVL